MIQNLSATVQKSWDVFLLISVPRQNILRNSERRKKIEDLSMHRIVINSAWMCPSLIYDPNTFEAQAHPTGLRFRVDEMEAPQRCLPLERSE